MIKLWMVKPQAIKGKSKKGNEIILSNKMIIGKVVSLLIFLHHQSSFPPSSHLIFSSFTSFSKTNLSKTKNHVTSILT